MFASLHNIYSVYKPGVSVWEFDSFRGVLSFLMTVFNFFSRQLQSEVEQNCSLREELSNLQNQKSEVENHSRLLEDQLDSYIATCEQLQVQNESIRHDLVEVAWELDEEKKKWYNKNSRELALLSLSALQKIANALLPVFLDSTL